MAVITIFKFIWVLMVTYYIFSGIKKIFAANYQSINSKFIYKTKDIQYSKLVELADCKIGAKKSDTIAFDGVYRSIGFVYYPKRFSKKMAVITTENILGSAHANIYEYKFGFIEKEIETFLIENLGELEDVLSRNGFSINFTEEEQIGLLTGDLKIPMIYTPISNRRGRR